MNRGTLAPFLRLRHLGATGAFRKLFWLDVSGQLQQTLGEFVQRNDGKIFRGQHNLHSLIPTPDLNRQLIDRGFPSFRLDIPMSLLDASLEYGQDVIGQYHGSEPEQGSLRAAKGFDLTLKDRFQSLEHTFDAPTAAIERRDQLCPGALR